jgi:hypothetical protein
MLGKVGSILLETLILIRTVIRPNLDVYCHDLPN